MRLLFVALAFGEAKLSDLKEVAQNTVFAVTRLCACLCVGARTWCGKYPTAPNIHV